MDTRVLLVGRSPRRSWYWVVVAVGWGLVSWSIITAVGLTWWLLFHLTVISIQSFDNDGLVVSLMIGFCGPAGALLSRGPYVNIVDVYVGWPEFAMDALTVGVVSAVLFGTLGYLVGQLLTRLPVPQSLDRG